MKPETLKVLLRVLHETFGPVGREGYHPLHPVVQAEIGETPDGLWGPRTEDGARKLSRRCSGTHPTLDHSTAVLTALFAGKPETPSVRRKISFGEAVTLMEQGKETVKIVLEEEIGYKITDGVLRCRISGRWTNSLARAEELFGGQWFIDEEPCT